MNEQEPTKEQAPDPNEVGKNLWLHRDRHDQGVTLAQAHSLIGNKVERVYLNRDNIPAVIARLQQFHAEMVADIESRREISGPHRSRGGGTSTDWEYYYVGMEQDREKRINAYGATSAEAKETARKAMDRWLNEKVRRWIDSKELPAS